MENQDEDLTLDGDMEVGIARLAASCGWIEGGARRIILKANQNYQRAIFTPLRPCQNDSNYFKDSN